MGVVTVDGPGGERSVRIDDDELLEYIVATNESAKVGGGSKAAPAKKPATSAKG